MSKHKPSRDWDATNTAILAALDIRSEYEALGVETTGGTANEKGWLECRAVGRPDNSPSACINIHTGRYKDSGGDGLSLSLWDFAAHVGRYQSWQEARATYAEKAGVKIGKGNGKPKADPAEHLHFLPWNDSLVALWCLKKPGIIPEAVKANGGRLARYRDQFTVIALPIFGAAGTDADPVGWVMFNTTGKGLPVYRRGQPEPTWKKMKVTYGSEPGLIGAWAFNHLSDDLQSQQSQQQIIWNVEGPTCLLSFWGAIPPELRTTHLVLTNANGANEDPKPSMLGPFVGRRVNVIRDCDEAGESGGEKWAKWLANSAAEVRRVKLPYPVEKDHGKDIRDFICDGFGLYELGDIAENSTAITLSEANESGPAVAVPIEADDDPHRLARVYLESLGCSDGLPTLRYWREEWWLWDGRCYRKQRQSEIRRALNGSIKAEFDRLNIAAQVESESSDGEPPATLKVTTRLLANVFSALEFLAGLPDSTEQQTWLTPAHATAHSTSCIATASGILDIDALLSNSASESCLFPHTPAWFSPVCLPYPAEPSASCPKWLSVTASNLEHDAGRISLLQEWAGYLLLPDTSQQRFLILEGEGANGKSVYLAGIEAMLGGSQNVSHVALEKFSEKFALSNTLGKLANIAGDCGEIDKVAEGNLKSFTAGEPMGFERKFLSDVSAIPTARLMMATNNRPRFSDKSSGVWRRMILVPFQVEIQKADRIYGMDKPQWWLDSGECPGILNWAIAGLHRLRQRGEFTESEICTEAIEDYREESNPARAFLEERVYEEREYGEIAAAELYKVYKKWCENNGYHPLGERLFGKELRRKFPHVKRRRLGDKGKRYYVYSGVLFADETLN